jgi:hypothetical protein
VGFEGGLTQLPSPGTQRPVGPVPAKIDYAVSDLGDDAGGLFRVGMVADPWVLERRANVVILSVHCLILPLRTNRRNAGLRTIVPRSHHPDGQLASNKVNGAGRNKSGTDVISAPGHPNPRLGLSLLSRSGLEAAKDCGEYREAAGAAVTSYGPRSTGAPNL